MTWETAIKIILFAIVLAIALNFCFQVYITQMNNSMKKEHRRALSDVYQTIKHFDPQFNKISKKVLLNTKDYTIRGFGESPHCDENCICLCVNEECTNLESNPYDYCKKISDYKVDDSFFIDSKDMYRRIEIKLIKDSSDDYIVTIGTKEDA